MLCDRQTAPTHPATRAARRRCRRRRNAAPSARLRRDRGVHQCGRSTPAHAGSYAHPAAYVYNFHDLNTDEDEFEKAADKCKGSTIPVEDEDFKWLFWLLDTPTDGWDMWRGTRLLPTPFFWCDKKTSAMAPKNVTAAASKEHAAEAKGPTDSDCLAGTFKI